MKIPIIIQDSKIPKWLSIFINIWAITIWPFIICKGKMDKVTLNHEKIHIRQQAELLIIGFYPLYAYYWLKARLWHKLDNHTAYMAIPFEVEAYDNEEDEDYLKNRKWFAWWGYRGKE